MPNGKGGRPPGVNCERDVGCRCKKSARVRMTVLAGGGEYEVLRCWEHYVELECAARSSSTLFVTHVEIL